MQLLALTLLLVAGAWAGRRLMRSRAETVSPLRIVARAGLTQKSGLALIEAEGRTLLVGYGGDGAPVLLRDAAPMRPRDTAPVLLRDAVPPAAAAAKPRPSSAAEAPEIILEDLVEIAPPASSPVPSA